MALEVIIVVVAMDALINERGEVEEVVAYKVKKEEEVMVMRISANPHQMEHIR